MVIQTLNMKPSFRIRGKRTFIPRAGLLASFLILVIMGFMMAPIAPDPNLVEAAARVSSMDLTVSTTGARLNIIPTSIDGTFATSTASERANISVITDNYTGYTLTIKGTDNTGNLTNSTTGATLASISSAVPASTFSNKDYKDTYNGKWGYKPSKLNSTTNTNYLPAPTTTATTLDVTTSSNPTTANSYTLDLGARVDYSNVAGSYNKTFILAAVGNQTPYTINYLDGSSTILAPTVGNVTGTTVSATVSSTIPTKTGYTFNGWCTVQVSADSACSGTKVNAGSTYNFIDQTASSNVVNLYAMWNRWTYTLNLDFDGSTGISSVMFNGNVYVNDRDSYTISGLKYGESYYINAASDMGYDFNYWAFNDVVIDSPTSAATSFVYYPVADNTTTGIHPVARGKKYSVYIYTSEGISSVNISGNGVNTTCTSTSGCNVAVTYGKTYTLTASAAVGYRFSDWSNNSSYGSFSSTTDNPASFTIGAGDATITANGKSSKIYMQNVTSSMCTTTAQTVYDNRDEQTYVIQKLADGNCWMMTNLNLNTSNTDLTSSNTNLSTTVSKAAFNGWKKTSGSGTYTSAELIPVSGTDSTSGTAYGTLYNYCAASAGTICTSSNSSDASYDICPKGWRLPTGGSSGEFQALYNQSAYNSNANMRKSYTQGGAAFALAGYFHLSTPTNQGSGGRYWSSTPRNSTSMYYLSLTTSDVYPANDDYRGCGYSIRCVLK